MFSGAGAYRLCSAQLQVAGDGVKQQWKCKSCACGDQVQEHRPNGVPEVAGDQHAQQQGPVLALLAPLQRPLALQGRVGAELWVYTPQLQHLADQDAPENPCTPIRKTVPAAQSKLCLL